MSQKHANISIFVPHIGCPNKCSFCNQRYITGVFKAPHPEDVIDAVERAKKSPNFAPENTQIAFFGGSFTAINRNYMLSLLDVAAEFVEKGEVSGIRISTRPDCINEEILDVLKHYGVTSIELGCQSMSDEVLKLNNRGHTAEDVLKSAKLIKAYGFEFGVQMMTGLYGDTKQKSIETAEKLIALSPDTARIYPTVVLEGTELERLYRLGADKAERVARKTYFKAMKKVGFVL